MKKVLLFASIIIAVVACNLEGHGEYSMTSISNFEYDVSNFDADSLYQKGDFEGGSASCYLWFESAREAAGEKMTGGTCLTMKKDSSIVLKEENAYPQYTMFAKSAGWGSTISAVYYQNDDSSLMPEHDIIFYPPANTTSSCNPAYFMINNTQQTVYDVLSEDSPSKFEPGDWLKLTITGSKVNESTNVLSETGKVEFYLADWRRGYAEPDSVLTSWKTVTLSKLGDIDYIDFNIETSKEELIKTFCFDNLVSSVYIEY